MVADLSTLTAFVAPPPASESIPNAAAPCEIHVDCLVRHLRRALIDERDQRERGHVLFTDRERRYLGSTALGTGGPDHLLICPRRILEAGFALKARGMILAHNHPSGECRPSRADHEATERLRWLGSLVDLTLHDHLIVTRCAVYSMRAGGLL